MEQFLIHNKENNININCEITGLRNTIPETSSGHAFQTFDAKFDKDVCSLYSVVVDELQQFIDEHASNAFALVFRSDDDIFDVVIQPHVAMHSRHGHDFIAIENGDTE